MSSRVSPSDVTGQQDETDSIIGMHQTPELHGMVRNQKETHMKSALRRKSTAIALAVGVMIGMLVPMPNIRAQRSPFGTSTPFGPQLAPRFNPNDCEQHYQAAMTSASALARDVDAEITARAI